MRATAGASLALWMLVAGTCAAGATDERKYELDGRIVPEMQASITLHGATSAFSASTLSDTRGHFRMGGLDAGTYTISIFVPGRGDVRRTLDLGPSNADRKGRLSIAFEFDEASATPDPGTVSARDLSIPERARKEYAAAQKVLGKRDTARAIEHLRQAVTIAPGFAQAWNNLGTIAYHERRYADAERYFRKGLEADPSAYEPLVNLGGVLLNLDKYDEAYTFNLHAVLKRPNDPLANSQLGMTYTALGRIRLAEKYLLEAVRLDPGHFSHPQLLLAEIYLREKRFAEAAAQMDQFLHYHPDYPAAAQMREAIGKLRRTS